jgi:predicted P-loop ATPase
MNIEKIKKTYGTDCQTCEQVWNQAVEAYKNDFTFAEHVDEFNNDRFEFNSPEAIEAYELSEYFEEHVEEYYLPEAWEQYDYETR